MMAALLEQPPGIIAAVWLALTAAAAWALEPPSRRWVPRCAAAGLLGGAVFAASGLLPVGAQPYGLFCGVALVLASLCSLAACAAVGLARRGLDGLRQRPGA
jgi:hypothetical protein